MLDSIRKEKLMQKVIAILVSGMFAAVAFNTFAADAAAPATGKKHHDKHHDKAHMDKGSSAPAAPAAAAAPAAPAPKK